MSEDADSEKTRRKCIDDYHNAIWQLQRYVDGDINVYPTEELLAGLENFHSKYTRNYSEGYFGGDQYRLICFRLLQQMVRFVPDIKMLAHVVSPDGRVAIMNMGSIQSVYYPCSNPVFFCDDEGRWQVYMREGFMPTKIYPIERNNIQYYLLSHHGELGGSYSKSFTAGLFYCAGTTIVKAAIYDNELESDFHSAPSDICFYHNYIYNARKFCWNICEKRGEYFYPVEGSKTLYIRFDENPRFVVE